MTLYLSIDGVDDYLKTPLLNYSKISIIFKPNRNGSVQYYVSANGNYNFYTTSTVDYYTNSADFEGFYINGVKKNNNSRFITNNEKQTLDIVRKATTNHEMSFFSRYDNIGPMACSVYDIKLYNGTNLVAHYDMSTGTVQDQSGNGNHATLVGGTWLDDGTGGTPVDAGDITLSSSTNLSSTGSKITNAQTTLQSFSNLSIIGSKVSTGESNLTIQTTLQGEGSRIVNGESQLQAITSLIAEGEILSLDISVNLSASSSLQATGTKISTGQSTLSANGQLLSTGTVIYNGESILVADTNLSAILGEGLIGNITLEGSRQLNIYLLGNRELNTVLQGKRELHVTLQGSV